MITAFIMGLVLLAVPVAFYIRAGMTQSKRTRFNLRSDCVNLPLLAVGFLVALTTLTILVRVVKGAASGGLPGPEAVWIFVACLALSILTRFLPQVINVFVQIGVTGIIILLAAVGSGLDLGVTVDAIHDHLLLFNSLFLTMFGYWGVNTWFTWQKPNWPKFLTWALGTALFISIGVTGQRIHPEGSANAPMLAQYARQTHAAQFDGEEIVLIPQRKPDRHEGEINYYQLMHPEISGEWSPLVLRSGQRIVVSSDSTSLARAVRFWLDGTSPIQPLGSAAQAEFRVAKDGKVFIGLPKKLKQTIRFGLRIYD